jgi:hypothetical protein
VITSAIVLTILAVYYYVTPRPIVGDSLVNTPSGTPLELPTPGTFFFYVKPVTIMFFSLVTISFSGFTLLGGRLSRLPRGLRAFLMLVSLLVLVVSVYEVLFNFTLWGSLLVKEPNPDTIVNSYPVSSYKTNLAFATKAFVALLFVSYFAFATFKNSLDSANTL